MLTSLIALFAPGAVFAAADSAGDRNRAAERIAEAAIALSSSSDLTQLLDQICREAVALSGASWASVSTGAAASGVADLHVSFGAHGVSTNEIEGRRLIASAGEEVGTLRLGPLAERTPLATDPVMRAFTRMCGLAIERTRRESLLRSAAGFSNTDPLTGLANARAFRERLTDEVERAARHSRSVALALITVDHYQQIEQVSGQSGAGRTVVEVARRMVAASRAGDGLARVGPAMLAWILPEASAEDATRVVDAVRSAIARQSLLPAGVVTVSCGVAGLQAGDEASNLYFAADRSVHWAMEQGGNRCSQFDRHAIPEAPSDDDHDRAQASASIETVASLVDAKDPLTRGRSERVAAIAGEIAQELGWAQDRVARLIAAARVHDVGLLAVPGSLLRKTGQLTTAERAQLRHHASLGAEIVAQVLDPEQTRWIRSHHERPDGLGYPHGLRGDTIPLEAGVIGLSAAWNAMTSARRHRPAMEPDVAIAAVSDGRGVEFVDAPAGALIGLWRRGSLRAEVV